MASFFDVMSRQTSRAPDERTPEFLLTHPVTSARIAEARSRARNYPKVNSEDSISYSIAKIRTIVYGFDTAKEAVAYFEKRPYQNQNEIERYGRLLAYLRDGSYGKALDIVEYLVDRNPKVIAYHIALGETQVDRKSVV